MVKNSLYALLFVTLITPAFAQRIEVIDLNHRSAEELIPTIEALLDPGEAVTAHGYQLIVKAKPSTLETIHDLLDRIDKAPAQLLISVSTRNDVSGNETDVSADAYLRGKHFSVQTEDRDEEGIELRADSQSRDQSQRQTPQVRATEGRPAWVGAGSQVPVRIRQRRLINGVMVEQDSVDYRNVASSFYVTAWLSGERVRLDIEQQQQQPLGSGNIQASRISTSVNGRLGEWIAIGGVSSESRISNNGILSSGTRAAQELNLVYLKVDKIN